MGRRHGCDQAVRHFQPDHSLTFRPPKHHDDSGDPFGCGRWRWRAAVIGDAEPASTTGDFNSTTGDFKREGDAIVEEPALDTDEPLVVANDPVGFADNSGGLDDDTGLGVDHGTMDGSVDEVRPQVVDGPDDDLPVDTTLEREDRFAADEASMVIERDLQDPLPTRRAPVQAREPGTPPEGGQISEAEYYTDGDENVDTVHVDEDSVQAHRDRDILPGQE